MNLDELEYHKKHIKKKEEIKDDKALMISEDDSQDNNIDDRVEAESSITKMKLYRRRIVITILVSLFVGIVFGLSTIFIASQYLSVDVYGEIDYSEFETIGESNKSIDSLYETNEEKFYSLLVTGMAVPNMSLLDNDGNSFELYDVVDDNERYIIEFVKPSCPYCEKMIEIVEEYNQQNESYKVIVISMQDADIAKFHDSAYILNDESPVVNNFVNRLNWVPAFLFVENNTVNFVKYGDFVIDFFAEAVSLAFSKS